MNAKQAETILIAIKVLIVQLFANERNIHAKIVKHKKGKYITVRYSYTKRLKGGKSK